MKEKPSRNSRRRFLQGMTMMAPAAMVSPFFLGTTKPTGSLLENHSPSISASKPDRLSCDLLVYGATSAGVIAAYTGKMYGLKVLLVEPGRHLGGMTSGGLGRTDTGGQDSYITGLSQEFYIRIGKYYGQEAPAYAFEPHVAELIFKQYLDEAEVEVLFSRRIKRVRVQRAKIWNEHKKYQQGLWWFLATDSRIPAPIRKEVNTWGYCRDEFLDADGWPHQLYIREARRMVGDFVMTEHECIGARPVSDGIAKGGYALDSHVVQRVVIDGHVENEGNISVHGFDPYLISYRSIIPKREEIHNLCVPVCVSSSHAAYGSLRMEPVFMALGQAAGVASYLAMRGGQILQDVPVTSIQQELRDNPLPNRKTTSEYADILPFKIK